MSFKKIFGILSTTVVAILFFSYSCINMDNTMGSDLVPDDHILKVNTAQIDLPIAMAIPDSMQSDSYSIILGTIYDDLFGKISVNSAVGLYIREVDSIDFGVNPVLKRAYIEMTIDSTAVLTDDQSKIIQNIKLYELNRALDTTTLFSNSLKRSDYSEKPINSNISATNGSSIYFELKQDFAEKLINTPKEVIDSVDLFHKYHHGLFFAMDLPEGEQGGRLNYISCSGKNIRLEMIYNDPDKNLYDRDTTFYIYLGSYGLSSYSPMALNVFENHNPKFDIENIEDKIYIAPFNGVKPQISAKELKSAIENWAEENSIDLSKIVISRASLEFPFDENTDYLELNKFPISLYPCLRSKVADTLSVRYYMPLEDINITSVNHGNIDRSLSFYKPDITSHLNKLIKNDYSKIGYYDDIWMIPITTYTDSYTGSTYYDINSDSYYKGVLNGTSSERKPVLKIAYAIMN